MARPIVFAVPSLIVFAFFAGAPSAIGQATKTDKERLVGSWTEVSITASGGGSQAQPFGPNPNGMMMVDAGGHLSLITLRADLPKFQSNNRMTGTADENKAIVQGINAYLGTYVIDEATHEITITIKGSTFPNFNGTIQKRLLSFRDDDEFTFTVPNPSGGGPTTTVVFRRAK
jgi:lipocalin-like protein